MTFKPVEEELREDPQVQSLCRAFLVCSSDEELFLRLMRDVLSFSEIQKAAKRWAMAQHLLEGKSQATTAEELGVSTRTVNNMARWVDGFQATGGILEAYKRLKNTEVGE